MKILVANIPLPTNRFLVDLHAAMEGLGIDLEQSHEKFWEQTGDYDVVHLHFPEYATFDLQDAYVGNKLTDDFIDEIEARLKYWADHARIVITRHVLLPHAERSNPKWERLYEIFYTYADAVVHFANASIEEFKERYLKTQFYRGVPPTHAIVPHANYASLPNEISRQQARSQLGISPQAKVMLVFGAIRNDDEAQLILDTFNRIQTRDKILLVSRWREKGGPLRRVERWQRDAKRLYYKLHPRYVFNFGFVKEEDAQLYLNAADVLFIPRLKVLNSGNITLGMTFGKVVVGPNCWDVGELLRETGNVVFDEDHPATASAAMEQAFDLAANTDLGERNRQLALGEWTPAQCAALYLKVYQSSQTQAHTS